MPGYDRTGPKGMGPRTGGGFGFCGSPNIADGRNMRGSGRGFGAGFGGGRSGRWGGYAMGRRERRWWRAPWSYWDKPYPEASVASATEEKAYLNFQAQRMREELASIEKRLTEMEKTGNDAADASV